MNIATHLSLWVHGRERPNAEDYWDGNWLNVMVRVEANGATVETSGPILRNDEIADFCKGLEELQATLTGEARLVCSEPNLGITFTGNGLGHIAANISITPDHLTQNHQFTFALDQTYVRPLITACKDILSRYPIRDAEGH